MTPTSEFTDKTDQVIGILLSIDEDCSGPLRSARDSAGSVGRERGDDDSAIAALTCNHVALVKARNYGLSNLIPSHFEVPVDISSTLVIQAHLIACIARLKGFGLHSEKLRDAILVCLLANAGADLLQPICVSAGTEIGFDLVHRLPTSVIKSLDKKIAVPLLTLKVVPK